MKLPTLKIRKPSRRTALILTLVALIALGVVHGARKRAAISAAPTAVAALELSAADLAEARVEALARTLRLSGYLQPLAESVLTASVEGRIDAVYVRPGEKVRAGQELARMDSRDLGARVAEAQANLAANRAQLDLAEKTQARNEELKAKNFISGTSLDTSKSQLAAQQEATRAGEARLALARQALEKSVVRALIAGIVAERAVQPGQHVGLNARLFSVVDLGELEFAATVPVSQVGSIRIGQTVKLTAEGSEAEASGRVERIAPTADSATRMIPVYIRVKNADGTLKGGMSVQGEVRLAEQPQTLTLPREALRKTGTRTTVLVVVAGKAEERPVEAGLADEASGRVEIKSGVQAGETVILARVANLQPGQAVVLPKPAAAAATPAVAK